MHQLRPNPDRYQPWLWALLVLMSLTAVAAWIDWWVSR